MQGILLWTDHENKNDSKKRIDLAQRVEHHVPTGHWLRVEVALVENVAVLGVRDQVQGVGEATWEVPEGHQGKGGWG